MFLTATLNYPTRGTHGQRRSARAVVLGRWEEGAATIDAASFRDKQGRWWRAEIDDLGHPVFRIVSDPPVAWARPLPLDKRLELGVSYGVKKVAVAIAQKFKASKL